MRTFLLLSLAALCIGCNDDVAVYTTTQTELRFQNPPTEVDILLVVDDSCSMADEQAKLGEGFDSFVTYFDEADVDYHIGVTTTDMLEAGQNPQRPGVEVRGRLIEANGVTVIDRDTPDPAALFREMTDVGVLGAGREQGLLAAMTALSPPVIAQENAGFLRENALLSVIFISDEEDASNYPVDDWINDLRAIKGSRNRDAVNVSALIGVDEETGVPQDCGQTGLLNEGAVAGRRYHDVATRMGGVVASICSESFTDIVARMGLVSSRLKEVFELSRKPREDTLEVVLVLPDDPDGGGIEVPPEGTEDGDYPWVYEEDEEGQWVRFTDILSLPPLNTQVILSYEGA